MTKEQRERNLKLADALDSGEYKQTRRYLHGEDGFCCLGVACDLYMQDTGRGKWEINGPIAACILNGQRYAALPPASISRHYGWGAGAGAEFPQLSIQGIRNSAVHFNDDGANFSEIADGFRWLAAQSSAKIRNLKDVSMPEAITERMSAEDMLKLALDVCQRCHASWAAPEAESRFGLPEALSKAMAVAAVAIRDKILAAAKERGVEA